MADVKINVGAGVGGVEQAIAKVTAGMNKLGAAVASTQKLKFEPVGLDLMKRDLALVNKQFAQALALSAQLRNALKASGQQGAHLSQIDWSKTSTNPAAAQRMRDRAFRHAVQGTALDPTLANDVDDHGNIIPPAPPAPPGGGSGGSGGGNRRVGRRPGGGGGSSGPGGGGAGGGSWWRRRPQNLGTATALAAGNGIGGPLGNIVTAGIAGGPVGALLAGLTSGVGAAMSFASDGMDKAKERNLGVDYLKRSLGDIGVSFDELTGSAIKASQGLGMASNEFVKMEGLANESSGGAYRTPEELAQRTRRGVDLARAYGLDPSQGVQFAGSMQRMNPHQNNKELATSIAEAIGKSQGHATPGEMMQMIQGFTAQQNRFNSGSTDTNRLGNAFSSLLNSDGMTAEHASGILGTANASMQQMGGTEASRNATMQAFGLDPIKSGIRAEGGLFENGLDNKDIGAYMRVHRVKDWDGQDKGPAGTNFSIMKNWFDNQYKGRGAWGAGMELDAEQNYFGLKSKADTAAFMNMSDSDHNSINAALKNAGVRLSDVREGGLQALSGISRATSLANLKKLYASDLAGRPDMSDSDRDAASKALGSGNLQDAKNGLLRIMAGKGQSEDLGTNMRQAASDLDDIAMNIGQKIAPGITNMESWIEALAKKMLGIGDGFAGPEKPVNTATGFNSSADPSGKLPGVGTMTRPGAAGTGGLGSLGGSAGSMKAYILSQGVDEAHADAILGNAMRESSLNPNKENASGHYGLFQFSKQYQDQFAKKYGHSMKGSSPEEQMGFMLGLIRKGGAEYENAGHFWNAKNAGTAGVMLGQDIERPGNYSQENPIRFNLSNEMAKIPAKYQAATAAGAAGGRNALPGQAPMVIIELDSTTNIHSREGRTNTKRLSTTRHLPIASGVNRVRSTLRSIDSYID